MADPILTDAPTSAAGTSLVPAQPGPSKKTPSAADGEADAEGPTASAPDGRPGAGGRVVRTVLGTYVSSTLVHLAVLAVMIPPGGPGIRDRLLAWDALLYLDIATDGYPEGFTRTETGEIGGNNLAFFPLFPLLTGGLHRATGLDAGAAALVIAHLSLVGAMFAVHALLTRLYDQRTATVGIVLLAGAQPMALTFLMGYSEALFVALAAAALLAAHRGAWLTAGFAGLLAGLTRPAAFALAVALALAALLALRRAGRLEWRPLAAVALACVGTPAYLLWVGVRAGQWDAWFLIQEAGWGTAWDNGAGFFSFLRDTFERGDGWVPVSTAVLLVGAVVATAVAWRRDAWPPLLVYGTTVVVLTLAQSNYYHSKLRLLVPALIFLLPFARALGRARPRTAVLVLVGATLFGSWYGAYMVTVWRYAI
ncbi:hypothetical protein [Streptomyces sp. NPDC048057]|uniref:hypothetical protein n=1 Tax=Streptomyces sp. NPDC048057 TaxID=3155628 RepID=UPI0033F0D56D